MVKRCLENDQVAQHAIFTRYASAMLGLCYRYANNKPEAEDMMQDGFVLVFKYLGNFKFESSLKTWITRIMINNAINYIKKYHKIKWDFNTEMVSDSIDYSEEQFHQYDSGIIMQCIQQLPLGYKMVLNLHAIEGLPHKDVAEKLNIKEATSRSQYAKAKVYLQKLLAQKGINISRHEAK